jgi:hypothetical protein
MEIKMKEQVNTHSFTFKKKVIEEVVELMGRKDNYISNDVYFITMICFLDNMVENNLVIEALYDEADLENKMFEIVEPMFDKYVVSDEEIFADFNDVAEQRIEYMNREVKRRHHVSGFLYDIFRDMESLKIEDAKLLLETLLKSIGPKIENAAKPIPAPKTDAEIHDEVKQDIEDLKMKALIEQFQRESKEESTK